MTSPTNDSWTVETPGPSDRGLVVRLLEDVVALDPEVAPAVAARSVRPAQWLQQPRPVWTGIVVDPLAESRTIVGYAAVVADSESGRRLSTLLVAPAFAGHGVEAALSSAAAAAASGLVAPVDEQPTDDQGLAIAAVTYPAARVERPRRRAALLGAGAIALAGVLGVLAVQVGSGPLGGVLPFLAPDRTRSAANAGPSDPTASQTATPVATVPGATIAPDPDAATGPLAPTPTGGPTSPPSQPTSGPTSQPTGNPSQPPAAPGLTSSLLDPVVATVVQTVDGLTGDALAPVTGTVEETTDTVTDVVDVTLETVIGLLPAPRD